ncbi:MAG: DMT family transporter [Candidatus Hodarchaeota archaeon]
MSPTERIEESLRGYIYTLVGGISFGSTAILSSLLRDMGVPSIQQAFFRALLTTLFFGFILLTRPEIRKIGRADIRIFVVNGLFGVSLSMIAYLSSIAVGTPVAVAVTLSYLQPMFAVILARLLLNETVTPIRVAAVVVSIVGASIVSGIWQMLGAITSINIIGVALAASNGFFYAVYVIIGRLSGSEKQYHSSTTMFYSFLFGLMCVSVIWFLVGSFVGYGGISGVVLDLSFEALGLLLMLGVFGTIIPYGLLSMGLTYIRASIAGILLLVEPVSVMVMGLLILGEPLTSWSLFGSILVLSATILISLEKKLSIKPKEGRMAGSGDSKRSQSLDE